MKPPFISAFIALLVIPNVVLSFIPSRGVILHEFPANNRPITSSRNQVAGESLGETSNSIPGRRIPRVFGFLFDDTIRLLNPKSMASFQVERKKKYGSSIFRTRIFLRPTLFCTDAESMKELAVEESKAKLAAFFPPHHQKLFGKRSVLVLSGSEHQRIRQLLQTALAPSVLQQYQGLINASVKDFLEDLQEEEKGYIEIVPKLRAFFISLTLRVVLGTTTANNHHEEALARDLTIWSRGLVSVPLTFVPWSAAAKAFRARRRIVDRLQGILHEQERGDMISDGLLAKLVAARDNDDASLTAEDVIDNVLSLVFAGSDTTASAATSLWMTFPNTTTATSEPQIEELVDTTLHAFPPAPFSMRQIVDPTGIWVGGYHVPANYLVVYGVAGAALDTENDSTKQTSTVPFGVGPRMCPGRYLASMELQAIGRHLKDLEWTLDPDQNLEQRYTPGFFPKDGLRVEVRRKSI